MPVSSDGCPKHSPGFEHLNRLALVHDIHRSGEDDPQPGGGRAVLDQGDFAGRVGALCHLRRDLTNQFGIERRERRVTEKKCVQVLHAEPGNCVRIAYGEASARRVSLTIPHHRIEESGGIYGGRFRTRA
jgi:hypothetical protein